MKYDFLVDPYDSERVKVLSVWSEFKDDDLEVRPLQIDPRGRSCSATRKTAASG